MHCCTMRTFRSIFNIETQKQMCKRGQRALASMQQQVYDQLSTFISPPAACGARRIQAAIQCGCKS